MPPPINLTVVMPGTFAALATTHAVTGRLSLWGEGQRIILTASIDVTHMLKVEKLGGEPVSLLIGRRKFECEDETGCVAVPKEFLTDFRLSGIPAGLSIKPVEKIEGRTIYVRNDVALSGFIDGSASAAVEDMLRRKYWDGETGLSLHVAALHQAIGENDLASETHYEDDGDFIFLQYEITITQDLEIQEAICCVEATIESIERRADSLVSRERDGLLDIFDHASFESDLTFALNGKQPVALIMADIDHFKQVNDRFGHVVGDEVLRAVANIIASY